MVSWFLRTDARQRHVQRAGNGRGTQGQHINFLTQLLELLSRTAAVGTKCRNNLDVSREPAKNTQCLDPTDRGRLCTTFPPL